MKTSGGPAFRFGRTKSRGTTSPTVICLIFNVKHVNGGNGIGVEELPPKRWVDTAVFRGPAEGGAGNIW